jgi:pimeloyl-ACP methyl ester carboxylesterase
MMFFNHDGVELAYRDVAPTGEDRGEPILLIHGFASNHAVNWVNTLWVKTLTHAGRRVILLDNRGHGESAKLYTALEYATERMAGDAAALLDHLGISKADVMGYSMGARITAFLSLGRPDLVRSAVLGGLGHRLIEGAGLPAGIADALEAPSLADVTDPMGRMFRAFADSTGGDRRALAACIRGTRQTLKPAGAAMITIPVLVCVGTDDPIAGDPHTLAALFPRGQAFAIPGRDHNLAVGDKTYKQAVLAFLEGVASKDLQP